MNQGIVSYKKKEATPGEDRFSTQRPAFQARDEEYLKPPPRDNTPAISVKIQVSGSELARKLLEQAKAQSLQAAKVAVVAPKDRKPRTPKASVTQATTTKVKVTPRYTDAHILNDKDFITFTRYPMTVFDKGGVALLYANGGGKFVDAGLTLATAWDALRREIILRLQKELGR